MIVNIINCGRFNVAFAFTITVVRSGEGELYLQFRILGLKCKLVAYDLLCICMCIRKWQQRRSCSMLIFCSPSSDNEISPGNGRILMVLLSSHVLIYCHLTYMESYTILHPQVHVNCETYRKEQRNILVVYIQLFMVIRGPFAGSVIRGYDMDKEFHPTVLC